MALASAPPVIVVLDLNALASITPAEWLEFTRVGKVYLPQAIYEEIRLAFDRSPDPDVEAISRAFNRMYATSGWETTDVTAHHPEFKPPSGQAVPKRMRLSLAAARCAFALSQAHPASMVVLVTSDRALLQKLYASEQVNLSGITPTEALQWSRTGQRTVAVLSKVHQLRGMQGISAGSNRSSTRSSTATRRSVNGSPPTSTRTLSRSPAPRSEGISPETLQQGFSLLLALLGVVLAGWLAWSMVQHFRADERPRQEQKQP